MDNANLKFEPFLKFNIGFHKHVEEIILLSHKILQHKALEQDEYLILQESFLVNTAAEWEYYIHCILSYSISLNSEQLSKTLNLNLPKKISFNNAYAILNGVNFLSIKNSDDLIGKSKKYITKEFNPFIKISKPLLKQVDVLYALRNHIAHNSKSSKESLLKYYSNNNIKTSLNRVSIY